MWTILVLAAGLALAPQTPTETPSPPAAAAGAKTWIHQKTELEEFLRTATVERIEDVPMGVTKPRRAFFAPGGLAASAIIKNLRPGRREGFWESYKSEIAAYEMDKLLGLDMVPVTVERTAESVLVSAQVWVEDCRLLRDLPSQTPPSSDRWNRQVWRQRVFDNLIANIDRNAQNILVDTGWNMILIDHSRAFTETTTLSFEAQMNRIDRRFLERVKTLDEPTLKERIRPWVLGDAAIRAILKRRDRIVDQFQKLAVAKGEGLVFVP